ncbi:type II toxin-antitoxin system death-on-curing family toxin [Pseudomonas gingeri]
MTWLPDHDDVKRIHDELTRTFESEEDPISPPGIKSQPLLESACARPHTGMGSVDKYESLLDKVAALFHSLTKNHAFHNGNKRTALVSMLTVLSRNNKRLDQSVTDEIIYNFVVSVTADTFPHPEHELDADGIVAAISSWLDSRSYSFSGKTGVMRTKDFIYRCTQAGATVKRANDSAYIIIRGDKSIRIHNKTRKISGRPLESLLRSLGLTESSSGLSVNEFQDGYSDTRTEIYRYMTALKRLAKT